MRDTCVTLAPPPQARQRRANADKQAEVDAGNGEALSRARPVYDSDSSGDERESGDGGCGSDGGGDERSGHAHTSHASSAGPCSDQLKQSNGTAAGASTTAVSMLDARVAKLEREEKARSALVMYAESIPQKVLKDAGIKLKNGPKRKPLAETNSAAFTTGVKVGKELNLNQQAIKQTYCNRWQECWHCN